MGLVAAHETPALTKLEGGVSSTIVCAQTARGPVCIKRALPQLKVAATWFAPVERNFAELAWMRLAAQVVPAAVPPILGEDALARAFAMAYLPPERYPVWKQQLRDGYVRAETAAAVASVIVRIHAATAGRADIARRFANDAAFRALRLLPYFAAAAELNPECATSLDALIETTAATRLALVHGDVSPKNILVGADGPVLLDAECACYGDPAFDVAFCLTHLLLKCLWRPAHGSGYLCCFDAFVAAYLAGVSWEPPAVLEARACTLLAGMLLARVDGKSPVEYLTSDQERALVRALARQLLLEGAARLATIRDLWAERNAR
ncbi:MAG: aminoglycoside phosphotransferase family protein [Burkholderiales bacterium]|nr:aminoglycoside phosphotransferase family protein [Burkholderiales bacterium]